MKIFIDTANLSEIEKSLSFGIISGVTTNPSLIKKAFDIYQKRAKEENRNLDMETYIKALLVIAKNVPVSLEVKGVNELEMYEETITLYKKFNSIANNVIIKIPINPSPENKADFNGLKVTYLLSKQKIPVNSTLIMTPEQALLAARAGAIYASPFTGRIDDFLRNKKTAFGQFKKSDYYPSQGTGLKEKINDEGIVSGVDLIEKIVKIYKKHSIETLVIAASIRNRRQVREVALAGADIATIPFSILEEMTKHDKTAEGIRKFLEDTIPEYEDLFK